jgi:hypothetical protein
MMNVLNGGAHADNPVDFHEFKLPLSAPARSPRRCRWAPRPTSSSSVGRGVFEQKPAGASAQSGVGVLVVAEGRQGEHSRGVVAGRTRGAGRRCRDLPPWARRRAPADQPLQDAELLCGRVHHAPPRDRTLPRQQPARSLRGCAARAGRARPHRADVRRGHAGGRRTRPLVLRPARRPPINRRRVAADRAADRVPVQPRPTVDLAQASADHRTSLR